MIACVVLVHGRFSSRWCCDHVCTGRGRAAHVPIVSGHTKAGINEFWMELLKVCKECTVPHQGVLVHKNALLQG